MHRLERHAPQEPARADRRRHDPALGAAPLSKEALMIERGLVIAGRVIPGTEWCIRDSSAWFKPGTLGTRERDPLINVLGGHWTAGEAGTGSYDDDGLRVYRVMRSRLRTDGTPMDVGIHFVVGACADADPFAQVWQLADPGLVACVHVGDRAINKRSIGVEVVSAGLPGPLNQRNRPTTIVALLGRMKTVLRFYPGQVAAWVRLAEALAALDGTAGISIPRRVPAFGASRRLSRTEARRWAGGLEHLHIPSTTKIDAAGLLVEPLADAGWERARP
jgi:hypothetical protein